MDSQRTRSGQDCLYRQVLRQRRNVDSDGANTTSSGSPFQSLAAEDHSPVWSVTVLISFEAIKTYQQQQYTQYNRISPSFIGPHLTAAMPRQVLCCRGILCGCIGSSMYMASYVRSRSRTRQSLNTRLQRFIQQRPVLQSFGFAAGSKWKNVDRFCNKIFFPLTCTNYQDCNNFHLVIIMQQHLNVN